MRFRANFVFSFICAFVCFPLLEAMSASASPPYSQPLERLFIRKLVVPSSSRANKDSLVELYFKMSENSREANLRRVPHRSGEPSDGVTRSISIGDHLFNDTTTALRFANTDNLESAKDYGDQFYFEIDAKQIHTWQLHFIHEHLSGYDLANDRVDFSGMSLEDFPYGKDVVLEGSNGFRVVVKRMQAYDVVANMKADVGLLHEALKTELAKFGIGFYYIDLEEARSDSFTVGEHFRMDTDTVSVGDFVLFDVLKAALRLIYGVEVLYRGAAIRFPIRRIDYFPNFGHKRHTHEILLSHSVDEFEGKYGGQRRIPPITPAEFEGIMDSFTYDAFFEAVRDVVSAKEK